MAWVAMLPQSILGLRTSLSRCSHQAALECRGGRCLDCMKSLEILPARAFWQNLKLMAPRRPASSRHQQIRSICEPVVCEGILRWCFAGLALPTDCEQAVNGSRAALGIAVAEEHASNSADCNCAAPSALPADRAAPDLAQLAAADPCSNGSGSAHRDHLQGSQEAEGRELHAAALLGTMSAGRAASPVIVRTAISSCERGPESKGGMDLSSPGHSSPPGAQSKPLSGNARCILCIFTDCHITV